VLVSLAWVKSAPDRRARCIDLDPEVITWAEEHNIAKEPQPVRRRLDVVCGNVLNIPPPNSDADKFDVICANNYSHQCLKDRQSMLCYLTKCRGSLAEGGIFVMDLCGVRTTPPPTLPYIALAQASPVAGVAFKHATMLVGCIAMCRLASLALREI